MAAIGGFRSNLSITRKTDGNFGNVLSGVLKAVVSRSVRSPFVGFAFFCRFHPDDHKIRTTDTPGFKAFTKHWHVYMNDVYSWIR